MFSSSNKIAIMCLAIAALSNGVHSEQEAAQTFGLLGAGLYGYPAVYYGHGVGVGVGVVGVGGVGVGVGVGGVGVGYNGYNGYNNVGVYNGYNGAAVGNAGAAGGAGANAGAGAGATASASDLSRIGSRSLLSKNQTEYIGGLRATSDALRSRTNAWQPLDLPPAIRVCIRG
ncbi:hypothetical protein PR003_g13837 [Phytophthora rubi]|uniref:RxLR effector protein n=1 Tax=Phytophthora rubi TaxID=129364 RepID=A0A6A4EWI6_9STRA|nr:hypothetical protein PR002_g22369 [Phytophthora rubi]KAE9333826.1 hypothetical protein PR003_g13837 [Phytophthora rubi]